MVLLDTVTAGTSTETYSEDADLNSINPGLLALELTLGAGVFHPLP